MALCIGAAGGDASPAAARPSQADTSGIRVQHLGQSSMSVQPGGTITAAFRVTNQTDSIRTVRPTADVPSEWTLATSLSPVTLSPKGRTMRLLSLSVPAQAPVRSERLRLRVVDDETPSLTDSASVKVQVQAVRTLRLSLLEAPAKVTAGDAYSVSFAVTNAGNVPTQVHLRAQSARSFRTRMDTSTVRLAPAKTRRVRATVHTTPVTRVAQDHVRLRAKAQALSADSSTTVDGESSDSTVTARASVEVIPTAEEDGSHTVRYPVSMQLHTLGNTRSRRPAGQIELQGASPDGGRDRSRRLEFFLRGPGQRQVATFGRRDVYRATYTTDRWTLRAGDQIYGTTSLAEPGRYGFGGEVRRAMGAWTLGAYAQTARRGGFGSQFATYATYDPHPRAALTASLLHNKGFFEGTLATIEGEVVPWKNASLTVEPGLGRGPHGVGTGIRVELSGEHEWGNYRTRHLYADTQFPSSRNGEHLSSAHARLRLTGGAFVFGNARYRRRSFAQAVSPLVYQSLRMGGRLRGTLGPSRWTLRVTGIDDRRPFRDRQSVRTQGRLQTGPLSLGTTVEVGQLSFGDGAFTPFRSYRGQLSLRASWQRFNGFVEYTTGPVYDGTTAESRASLGVSSRTQIGDRTTLFVEGEWRNVSSQTLPTWRTASMDLQHELAFGHTITAEARLHGFAGFQGGRTPEFKVSYDVPIGLPIGTNSEHETLTGRVVDAQTGTGVPDVLVHLGETKRFTDDTGRFSFPLPQNGSRYLRLDPTTVDGDRVPMLDLPISIAASDGASELVIPVQREASLTVQVTEYAYPDLRATVRGGEPEPVGGLGNVVLEATDDTGRQRRLTNAQGRATFKRLRPGTWTIRLVNPESVRDGKVLKRNTYKVMLESGDQQKLEMRVLPKRRHISIRRDKSLTLSADSSETASTNETIPPTSSRRASSTPSSSPSEGVSRDGQWAIVVASMSKKARAQTLAQKYQNRLDSDSLSVEILTVKLEQGTHHRVAVGPFENADAAQRALGAYEEKLPSDAWDKSLTSAWNTSEAASARKKAPSSSPLLASADASPSFMIGGASGENPSDGQWTIVVASMSKEARARTLAQKYRNRLDSDSLSVGLLSVELERGTCYRVVVGPFDGADAAHRMLENHEETLPLNAWRLRVR